jgi:hypothetical protein
MGGDGGVIASDRRYMRGAGAADHTADSKRASKAALAEAEREAQIEMMKTCAITGASLDLQNVVACPYGRLYGREAAVQALLRRMESGGSGSNDLGSHVRGLKDLHPVKFKLIKKEKAMHGSAETQELVPICPITSVELNGTQPAFLIVKSKSKKNSDRADGNDTNVLSEKGIKEMGLEALQQEYGPFQKDDMVRLAPPATILDEIKTKLQEKRLAEKASKSSKKKRKKEGKHTGNKHERAKRIQVEDAGDSKREVNASTSRAAAVESSKMPRTIDDVRSKVASTVASNSVLSGLYSDTKQSGLTDKQRKDNLFATNC